MKRERTRSLKLLAWAGVASALIGASESRAQSWGAVQLGRQTAAPGAPLFANRNEEICRAVAVDADQNTYCAGSTNGILGENNGDPTWVNADGAGGNFSKADAFVMKIAPNGSILWLTQLGANTKVPGLSPALSAVANQGEDHCTSVAVDATHVYCGGYTRGVIADQNAGDQDIFVLKIRKDTGMIERAVQFGANTAVPAGADPAASRNSRDQCNSIAVIGNNIYVGGYTASNFYERNASLYGNGAYKDILVMRLNKSDLQANWVRHLGMTTLPTVNGLLPSAGQGNEECNGITVRASIVYCAGSTDGDLRETNGGGDDAVIMKMSASTGAVNWIRQFGAGTRLSAGLPASAYASDDVCTSVAVDTSNRVYCAGQTEGFMSEAHVGLGGDAFVIRLTHAGVTNYVRQFGAVTKATNLANANASNDGFNGIVVDSTGGVYCAGFTRGVFSTLPASGGAHDPMVVKLNPNGTFAWAKQLGLGQNTVAPLTPGANVWDAAVGMWKYPANQNQNSDFCTSVALVPVSGDVVCAGYTWGSISEGNGKLRNDPLIYNNWVVGPYDLFLIRLLGGSGDFAPQTP